MTNSTACPSQNSVFIDQSTFWQNDQVNWDSHRIGWVVSGSCALLVSEHFFFIVSSSECGV